MPSGASEPGDETEAFGFQHDPSSSGGTIAVMRCDIGCPGVYEEIFLPPAGGAALGWIELEPGRYVARFVRSIDSPGEIRVSFF